MYDQRLEPPRAAGAERRTRKRRRWAGFARRPSDTKGQRGQSVVELSLIMPLLMFMLLGVADLGRVYATIMTTESAVREAADFGAFSASNWVGSADDPESNHAKTIKAMEERACLATSHLHDYTGSRSTCSNPSITISLTEADGSAATGCDDPERMAGPCLLRVDLDYAFDVMVPIGMDYGDVRLGLPERLDFRRTSVFAISSFELDQ